MIRWLAFRLFHRPVHRLYEVLHRADPPVIVWGLRTMRSCWICQSVWSQLEATPGFNERMRAAEEALEAGEGILFDQRDLS